ncbi:hypothetical protein O9H85_01675 [Paenibacillus filicis]|uniref:Uncharacterized protein n=1 Tax=Paenibacillus gyeongsangnamensis TaxID=3388067 RepID=A0ABT4Q2R1_9BACL|nr:hypothetical protein [Paenibacillus filicis]MCZ8511167.1 hypothetical protein [Paenibacillus filicis]
MRSAISRAEAPNTVKNRPAVYLFAGTIEETNGGRPFSPLYSADQARGANENRGFIALPRESATIRLEFRVFKVDFESNFVL